MNGIADQPDEGRREARTPPAQDFPAAIAPIAATSSPPGLQLDLLGEVAETSNAVRRGVGRPEGSGNKRNAETFDYLEARGFKAPEVVLMEIASADTRLLAARLAGLDDPKHVPFDRALEVLKLQLKAAADLMPYKLARKPQQHEIRKASLHLFMAGNLSPEQLQQIEQNQMLSVDALVGQTDNMSHGKPKDEADQQDN